MTLYDDHNINGFFSVGANIPYHYSDCNPTPEHLKEHKVRIDRTSQLLISMQLAVAEQVKLTRIRSVIPEITDYEEIVRATVIDKTQLLYNILNIEANYFSKRTNFDIQREYVLING